MRKYPGCILAALMLLGIICSCKKNSTDDYAESIKDKSWWGTLTNAGQPTEDYSVHFNADKSLKWNQKSGEYDGTWKIKDKRLTINIPTPSLEIKADITDDGKLMNIVTDNSGIVINSCEQIENPNISLDNTVWEGTFDYSGPLPLRLSFMPGNKLKIESALLGGTYTYSRSASGAVTRFSNAGVIFFFGVIKSGSEMRGSYAYQWQVTKK